MDHAAVAQIDGVCAVGVEAEVPLAGVVAGVSKSVAVQGNLDPVALLASDEALVREVEFVCRAVPMNRHVFNLGHGIRQETDLRKLSLAVETVRRFDQNAATDG
jgi:uroporphyrinogen decarboxylase